MQQLGRAVVGIRAAALSAGLLGAVLASAPAARAGPHGDVPLEQALGESWRWRAIQPPGSRALLTEVRPGPGGGVVASRGESLAIYDGWRWSHVAVGPTPWWPSLRAAVPLDGGWVVATDRKLFAWRADGDVAVLADRPASGGLTAPVVDDEGRLWAGLGDGIVAVDLHGVRPARAGPGDAPVIGLAIDRAGRPLWVDRDGLHRLEDDAWRRLVPASAWPDGVEIERVVAAGEHLFLLPRALQADQPGLVWDGRRLAPLPLLRDALPAVIDDAVATPDGALVLAARPARLAVWRDGRWRDTVAVAPLQREYVRSMCHTGDGRLVVVTASNRLMACDLRSRRWRSFGAEDAHERRTINALASDGEGGLWVGMHMGLGHWDGERFDSLRLTAGDTGIGFDAITGLARDDRGRLWVGSGWRGSFRGALEGDGDAWVHHTEPADIGTFPVHAIRHLGDGELWFTLLSADDGFENSGGVVRRRPGSWRRFTRADGLPHDRVYDVTATADGVVWAATFGGLARLEGERFAPVDEPGAPRGRAFTLHAARDGSLWVGFGLAEDGVAHRRPDGRWSQLPSLGGLPAAAAAFAEDPSGRLFFASDTGVYRVARDGFVDLTRVGEAPVSTFWPLVADERGLWLGSRFDGLMRYEPDDVTAPRILDFTTVTSPDDPVLDLRWRAADHWNVTPPGALRFALSVDDAPWTPLGAVEHHVVRGLAPGVHSIRIAVRDDAGNEWAMPEPAQVRVADPYARRRSLRVAGVLALMSAAVLLATGLVRQRERRREQRRLQAVTADLMAAQEDERRQISHQLHDDLGQLLTAVSLDLQLAERLPEGGPRADAFSRALATARDALDRARRLSKRLRPRLLDELGLDQALREELDEFARRTGVAVDLRAQLGPGELGEPVRGHLYRIVQDLLRPTAASGARRLTLQLRRHADHIEIDLWDDGSPWSPPGRLDGRRVPEIVRERVRQLGGRLDTTRGPDPGGRLFLSVPAGIPR